MNIKLRLLPLVSALLIAALSFAAGSIAYRDNNWPISAIKEWKHSKRIAARSATLSRLMAGSHTSSNIDLGAIGYAGDFEARERQRGTITARESEMAPGNTLVCSGHGPEVLLINPAGQVVRSWDTSPARLFPNYERTNSPWSPEHDSIDELPARRAHVDDSGHLYVIVEYLGIAKLSPTGTLLWSLAETCHHDFKLLQDGSILTLSRRKTSAEEVLKKFNSLMAPLPLYEDFILVIGADGVISERISILESIAASESAHLLVKALLPYGAWPSATTGVMQFPSSSIAMTREHWDVTHANSIAITSDQFIDSQDEIKEESWIVSLRNLNAIVSISTRTRECNHLLTGSWILQHQATPLSNGNILLLDNLGGHSQPPMRGSTSRAIEVDISSGHICWEWDDDGDLFTRAQGYVERLENGNTLVTETEGGRVIEVCPQGTIAWEWRSPLAPSHDPTRQASVMGARRID